MLVRFTKAPSVAGVDTLTCVRPNGSSVTAELPRQGILPHLAFHYVIESTLGWHDAVFGRIASGQPVTHFAEHDARSAPERLRHAQAHQTEALIECLEADQWAGASDPAAFTQRLLRACRRRAVPPPDLNAEELDRVRQALREFGAAWRPLPPGASLERTF